MPIIGQPATAPSSVPGTYDERFFAYSNSSAVADPGPVTMRFNIMLTNTDDGGTFSFNDTELTFERAGQYEVWVQMSAGVTTSPAPAWEGKIYLEKDSGSGYQVMMETENYMGEV